MITDKQLFNTTKIDIKVIAVIITIVILSLLGKVNRQKEIIRNLSTQVNVYSNMIDQVREDNEEYFYDILAETDVYSDYIRVNK